MDEFHNNGFGGEDPKDSTSGGGNYYTPPQSENNTTYHYSYKGADSEPEQPFYRENYGEGFNGYDGVNPQPPKKKKSTAAKIVIVVLIVCLVAAVAGLAVSIAGYHTESDSGKKEGTTSQVEGGASTKDSAEVPTVDNSGNYTVAGVAKSRMDSCVGITVYSQQASAYNYFYGYGNNNSSSEPTKSGEGSGVIMSESNGKTYIMTCAHVISGGDSFTVTLNDGTECEAKMVGTDAQTDIGVLSIEKTGLKIAEFANSDNLVVGEQVVAIGCPGGLEFMNSVTSGYVSALARPISSSIGYDNECIQTDTAINPGNSGGALFNMQGQVVGINSSKIASTDYEGMGFAVPSNTAVATANSLIKVGYVEGRAKLGITYSPITSFNNSSAVIEALAEKGFKDCEGAMVISEVSEDSDLKNKDVKQYDMIVAVNGKTMTSVDVMTSVLSDSKPGDTVKLTMARIENNEIKVYEIECKLIESKG